MAAGRSASRHRPTAWRPLPDNVRFEEAAALPVAGLTALRTLRHGAPLLGKRVLVTGAAGGVGHMAVQIAARSGAHVTAIVGSPERGRHVRGAETVVTGIDKAEGRFALILEAAGGASLAAAIARIEAKGTIVIFGNSSGEPTAINFREFAEHPNARIQSFSYFTSEAEERFAPGSRPAGVAGRRRLVEALRSSKAAGAIWRGSVLNCATGISPAKPCSGSSRVEPPAGGGWRMAADRIHLSVAEAREHAERALRGIGYDAEEARILADHMIDAALCGYEYSGMAKILNIPEHRRFKRPRRPISVVRETEVSVLYDGGNNVGMLAMYHAARAAIAKAAAHGFSVVGVTNSWMSGRSAYYVEMIATADLVGIHTASSSRSVAPFGGARPALGTNPIAFGMPSADGPVVLDMGTSAFMGTELALRERLGQLLPEGVAIDSQGQPTRDPTAARLGALLPFGGYKGYGLGFIVQALGVLAGSGMDPDKDDGYLFVVFKPDLLGSARRVQARGQRAGRPHQEHSAPARG